MLLFCAQNLAQTFNGREIFRKADFEVQSGEKVALVGANGVGKTSLLRMIAGFDHPSAGSIHFYETVRTAMLSQHFDEAEEGTLEDYLQEEAEGRLELVRNTLKKFGFSGQSHRIIATLSGGEKTRLQLARISLTGADLLLLDEPSNHLDTTHLDWLERFVAGYRGTVLLVSHDRYFLDRTVTRILELTSDGIQAYPGNYTDYQRLKAEKEASELKIYTEQIRQSRQLERAIEEQKKWAGQAHRQSRAKSRANGIRASKIYYRSKAKKMDRRVKSTVNRLERLREDIVARPENAVSIQLGFRDAGKRRDSLMLSENLKKSFGPRMLFNRVDFSVEPGEKVALIGANGSGKTTLLRMMARLEDADSGAIWRSPSLRMGYLEQEMRLLNGKRSILEELEDTSSDPKAVRNLLAGLLFKGNDVFKSCSVLSMGERVRVTLAKLLLADYDLLLMDEPTNYLDLPGRERLEDALLAFKGAVVLVSHDRYLIEKVAGTVWDLNGGSLRRFPGRYSDYQEHQQAEKRKGAEGHEVRMALELRKAYLVAQLAIIPKQKDPEAFERMESEYFSILEQLK